MTAFGPKRTFAVSTGGCVAAPLTCRHVSAWRLILGHLAVCKRWDYGPTTFAGWAVRKPVAVLVVLIGAIGSALAQKPPTESVTVTGEKTREAVDKFVKSVRTPTRITGKTARWKTPLCPYVIGVQPKAVAYIKQRLKEVAADVGAPFNIRENCQPNMQVIFNQKPDALMQDVKVKRPWILGYYDNGEERDHLAVFDHPIKAWYRTATRDVRGQLEIDKMEIVRKPKRINGSKLNDGLQSELYGVLIVANPDQLAGRSPEAVADYIAMLALAQVQVRDTCQNLLSITNLLAKDCADVPVELTINDLGYLRGIYSAQLGLVAHLQRHDIANGMEQVLEGK